jgi:RNA polymerase sigma-70 factor (family 1)
MIKNAKSMIVEKRGIDQVQFDQVFNQWYGPIRNFIYYKIGDVQAAEDLAQDTFLKIWEVRDTINLETVKSLAYTIANNLTLNKIKRGTVAFKFINNYQPQQFSTAPDFEMEMKEFDRQLQTALAELDERNRTVFLMNRIDEMTYNQIAEHLGLTTKAIEKRMEKALAHLRKRVSKKI